MNKNTSKILDVHRKKMKKMSFSEPNSPSIQSKILSVIKKHSLTKKPDSSLISFSEGNSVGTLSEMGSLSQQSPNERENKKTSDGSTRQKKQASSLSPCKGCSIFKPSKSLNYEETQSLKICPSELEKHDDQNTNSKDNSNNNETTPISDENKGENEIKLFAVQTIKSQADSQTVNESTEANTVEQNEITFNFSKRKNSDILQRSMESLPSNKENLEKNEILGRHSIVLDQIHEKDDDKSSAEKSPSQTKPTSPENKQENINKKPKKKKKGLKKSFSAKNLFKFQQEYVLEIPDPFVTHSTNLNNIQNFDFSKEGCIKMIEDLKKFIPKINKEETKYLRKGGKTSTQKEDVHFKDMQKKTLTLLIEKNKQLEKEQNLKKGKEEKKIKLVIPEQEVFTSYKQKLTPNEKNFKFEFNLDIENMENNEEEEQDENLLYKNYDKIEYHQFRDLIFAPKISEITFTKHLLSTHRGLAYATKQLKKPSDLSPSKYVNIVKNKDKLLVLDLDETLIQSCRAVDCQNKNQIIKYSEPDSPKHEIEIGIKIRPQCEEFLAKMKEIQNICIFTSSSENYAQAVVKTIDRKGEQIESILSRNQCIATKNGFFLKDLRIFKNKDLSKILIVDNMVHCFGLHIDNGIPILEWLGEQNDAELKYLIPYLISANYVSDVREFNREKLKLDVLSQYSEDEL